MYKTSWDALAEVEVAPGNYRRAASGLKVGINTIRWVHPSGVALHRHDESEQVIICTEGRMEWTVDGEELVIEAGELLVIPQGVEHGGRTLGADATFFEILAPTLIQTLPGFLGAPLH